MTELCYCLPLFNRNGFIEDIHIHGLYHSLLLGVVLVGRAHFARIVWCTPDVKTEAVWNHGNATVTRDGEDSSVTKVNKVTWLLHHCRSNPYTLLHYTFILLELIHS